MIIPKLHKNEAARIAAMKSYNILDTLPEDDYDNITKLAANICNIPIVLIGVIDEDRHFLKSHYGIPFNESPRDISFCGHAILSDEIMIVEDARKDERFTDNPLLTEHNAIFYAGVPLIDLQGHALGTICVFDHIPRQLTTDQIEALKILSKQVINLFELRRKNRTLILANEEVERRNKLLKTFASHVSHDLKSPLANINTLTEFLKAEDQDTLSSEASLYIDSIGKSATILREYIDGILHHYKSDELLKTANENFNLSEICSEIKQLHLLDNEELIYNDSFIVNVNKPVLSQILINLVDNAIKYNDKSKLVISIGYKSLKDHHQFEVRDNGIGIPEHKLEDIFEIFSTVDNNHDIDSTGIGLTTVKNLVEKQEGIISVESIEGVGSTFTFTIKK